MPTPLGVAGSWKMARWKYSRSRKILSGSRWPAAVSGAGSARCNAVVLNPDSLLRKPVLNEVVAREMEGDGYMGLGLCMVARRLIGQCRWSLSSLGRTKQMVVSSLLHSHRDSASTACTSKVQHGTRCRLTGRCWSHTPHANTHSLLPKAERRRPSKIPDWLAHPSSRRSCLHFPLSSLDDDLSLPPLRRRPSQPPVCPVQLPCSCQQNAVRLANIDPPIPRLRLSFFWGR